MDANPPRGRKRGAEDSPPLPTAGLGQEEYGEQPQVTRTRMTSELDTLDLTPAGEAWQLDMERILEEHGEGKRSRSNLVILCVMGELEVHYWLLRAALSSLMAISPGLQAFVITNSAENRQESLSSADHAAWASKVYLSSSSGFSNTTHRKEPASDGMNPPSVSDPNPFRPNLDAPFPVIQPHTPSHTFTSLGLLHPLGGGREPLDALVLVDRRGRRRLVLPFGWGAGRHVLDGGGGSIIRDEVMEILMKAVGAAEIEWMNESTSAG